MYRPIDMVTVENDGTKFSDWCELNYSDMRSILSKVLKNEIGMSEEEISFFMADVSSVLIRSGLMYQFYAGWYINPVAPYDTDETYFAYQLQTALLERVGYLKRLYTSLKETIDATPYSKEEYEFGSQGVTSERGERTDSSDYGASTQTEKQYQYPLTGDTESSSPVSGDVSVKNAHTDSTTYGSQQDKVTTDAHTNTVVRVNNTNPVKNINSLKGMDSFQRAFLDCFKDCFTLASYGTW